MVNRLEAGSSYRLVDKESYFQKHRMNKNHFEHFNNEGVYTLDHVYSDGSGVVDSGCGLIVTVITPEEYGFFELVEEVSTPTKKYWDGKEPLEVGMIVTTWRKEAEYKVVYSCGTRHCLKTLDESSDEFPIFIREQYELTSCLPDPKEEFCKEILTTIRGAHPDFAQDTTWDIKEVAAICWDKLKGGESE